MLCHSEIVGHGAHPLCKMMENRKEGGKERLGEGGEQRLRENEKERQRQREVEGMGRNGCVGTMGRGFSMHVSACGSTGCSSKGGCDFPLVHSLCPLSPVPLQKRRARQTRR